LSLNEKKLRPKLRLFVFKQNFIDTEQASTIQREGHRATNQSRSQTKVRLSTIQREGHRATNPACAYHKQTQKTNSTPRTQLQRYTAGINNKITIVGSTNVMVTKPKITSISRMQLECSYNKKS
jgi:hypothetical protein